MSSSNNASSGGIGISGAVFIVFLVLKLIGSEPVASWSWWWVTSPLWIPLGIVFAFFAVAAAVIAVLKCIGMANDGIRSRRKVARMMREMGD
jgi:hypothetical protein